MFFLGVALTVFNVMSVNAEEIGGGIVDKVALLGTPYELTADNQLKYNVNIPHVIVNQVYGGGKKTAYASHSFIELYNSSDNDVNLNGWSLQYRSSEDGPNSTKWEKLDLVGTIPARTSFLIRCASISKPESNLTIDKYDQEWNQNIHNKGYAVVLVANTDLINPDSMVFNNNTKNPMIEDFVDLFAVAGNDELTSQVPVAFESEVSPVQSKKIAIRRIGFIDTDNNGVGMDMETVNYSFDNPDYLAYILPRSTADGSWVENVAPTYTVTFVTNGAKEIPSQSVQITRKIVEPETPIRGTDLFIGWFSDEKCTEKYDFSVAPEKDIVLYAGWQKDEKASVIDEIDELMTCIPKYYESYYSEQSVNAISEIIGMYQGKDLSILSLEECKDLKNKIEDTINTLSYKVGSVPQIYISTDNADGNSLTEYLHA